MEDLQLLTRDRILQCLATDHNYLGWWTVPVEGAYELQRAIGIGDLPSITMVVPGVSVTIDGLSEIDNSRYSGSQRRNQQKFNIYLDHWLLSDIDITNDVVSRAINEYPDLIEPTQTENFGEVISLLMDNLIDYEDLMTVRKRMVRQRGVYDSDYKLARVVIGCVGNIHGCWSA
jgi:hypothetical protein